MGLICWLGNPWRRFSGREGSSLMLKDLVGMCDGNWGQSELADGSVWTISCKQTGSKHQQSEGKTSNNECFKTRVRQNKRGNVWNKSPSLPVFLLCFRFALTPGGFEAWCKQTPFVWPDPKEKVFFSDVKLHQLLFLELSFPGWTNQLIPDSWNC